jgi:uncharacterized protein DUF6790
VAEAIRFVLSHVPAIMFVAALVVAAFVKQPARFSNRLLCWMLLLSVGVEELWAGLFHVFVPQVAAASIGWAVSPFQFEMGVADIAIGITAITSFWRSLQFKAAVIVYVTLSYAGVAIGHVREAVTSGNFSENNFGLLLLVTVVKIVLLPILYLMVRKSAPEPDRV